jgi:hypothetical protein
VRTPFRRTQQTGRRLRSTAPVLARLWTAAVAYLAAATVNAQPAIPSAPAGIVETGMPPFVVFGPETLGVSTAPTDLALLPDGRVVVVAAHELAFGDGTRWEVFRSAEGERPIYRDVMVGDDDSIYFGIDSGIGRLLLGADGLWRTERVVAMPDDPQLRQKTMISVRRVQDEWIWYSGSGDMVNWRPGRPPGIVRNSADIAHLFRLKDELYASDQSTGGLYRVPPHGAERVGSLAADRALTITASAPFDATSILVGTKLAGLKLFDGQQLHDFGDPGPLTSGAQINDLCRVTENMFAAAVDTVGIVFFDRTGHVQQVLASNVDHRFARSERLRYSPQGALWVLLNEGIARVEYPSRVSRFEAMIPGGTTFVRPVRHQGRLWMVADGRVYRGIYDAAGRLQQFTSESPRT